MKICNKIVGNIKELKNDLNHFHIQKVILEQDELLKKMIIAHTDHHEEITISMNDNTKIEDGDIIFESDHDLIVAIINSDNLIVIHPIDFNQMGYIAHNLGNRHVPCQFLDNKIYLVYDYLIEEWLKKNNINFSVENIKLPTPFKYATLS